MNYTNIYNAIDTQDDFINCDRFLDIDIDFEITHNDLDLHGNEDRS